MRKIFILLAIALFAVALFADSGVRYSFDIEGIDSDTLDYHALETTIFNGANNIFDDAGIRLTPVLTGGGSVPININISGVLPVRKQTDTITFTGTGRVNITLIGATVAIISNDSLEVRLQEWANTYRTILRDNGIIVEVSENHMRFSGFAAGFSYDSPVITQVNGDLAGSIVTVDAILPNSDEIDMLILKFFDGIIDLEDAETNKNRDFY